MRLTLLSTRVTPANNIEVGKDDLRAFRKCSPTQPLANKGPGSRWQLARKHAVPTGVT